VRGEARLAGDEHHAIAEYFEALHLTVELRAELRRAVENGLRGDAPRVRVELETEVVPETSLAEAPKIFVGELFPPGLLLQTVGLETGLQLHQAWELRDQLAGLRGLERGPDRDDQISERVVPRKDLHRRPRAGVRRPEHEQTAVGMRHHA